MLNKILFISLLSTSLVALTSTSFAAEKKEAMDKCLGLAKAGMGDGKTTVDGKVEEWLLVPAGSCEKFVDGRVFIVK